METRKKEQIKPKVSQRKEIRMIKVQISEIEYGKQYWESAKLKVGSLRGSTKLTDLYLDQQRGKKKQRHI